MAHSYGMAGRTAMGLAEEKRRGLLVLAAITLGVIPLMALFYLLAYRNSYLLVGGLLVFVAVIRVLSHLVDQRTRRRKGNPTVKQIRRGAQSEVDVAALLAQLPDDYHIFNDLPKVAGDIDHIVVGPTGVFVVETKSHGGAISVQGEQVLVNGRFPEKDFVKQALRNAYWLHDVLKNTTDLDLYIRPLLVFPNGFIKAGPQVKGVIIASKDYLLKTITRQTPNSPFPVDAVVKILRQKMGTGYLEQG